LTLFSYQASHLLSTSIPKSSLVIAVCSLLVLHFWLVVR
jgi:hypothetical protein